MWPFKKKISLADSGIFKGFTDWHSHVLPGVDDGVRTMDEALEILALYEILGVKTVWLTPHIMDETPNSTAGLRERFDELRTAYKGGIRLYLAAEYMLGNLFCQCLADNDLLPAGGNADHLLLETSCFRAPMNFQELLEQVKSQGYHPVLAHPERYTYMETEDYRNLKRKNIKFQLNIPSLSCMYGLSVRKKALNLLQAGMYDWVGTDTHRYDAFSRIVSEKTIGQPLVRRLQKLSSRLK